MFCFVRDLARKVCLLSISSRRVESLILVFKFITGYVYRFCKEEVVVRISVWKVF